jgi:hypothetical protein
MISYSLAKRQLWRGEPFLIKTGWDAAFDLSVGSFSAISISEIHLLAPEVPMTSLFFRQVEPEEQSAGVKCELLTFTEELPAGLIACATTNLRDGVYEVTLAREDDKVILPEFIWILSRGDYVAAVTEEFDEEFKIEPLASTHQEFKALFLSTVFSRWPLCPINFTVSYASNFPIAYSKIGWMTSTILDSLKYLHIFEFIDPTGFISAGDDLVEFGFEARMVHQIPDEVIRAINDPECSDVLLMHTDSAMSGFETDIVVKPKTVRVEVRLPTPALAYA